MSHSEIRRSAFVLSGGGAYGAYEVGVMKALCSGQCAVTGKKPLAPDVFTGTSVGNFNAAVMVMYGGGVRAVEQLEQIWLSDIVDKGDGRGNAVYHIRGNPPQYFEELFRRDVVEPLRRAADDVAFLTTQMALRARYFVTSKDKLSHRVLAMLDLGPFICVNPFEKMVMRVIDPKVIRESAKVLRTVATNWHTGEIRLFRNEDITDQNGRAAILASAAIPGIFPPVKIGPDFYIDGGVVMNTPINLAVDAGANDLHIVDLNPDVRSIPEEHLHNLVDTFDRVYTTMLATKISEDMETAKWINRGLEVLERAAAGDDIGSDEGKDLLRVVGQIYRKLEKGGKQYKKLTIHRYRPPKSMGGSLGMLNFHHEPVRELIARGFDDARKHDCEACNCVIPKQQRREAAVGAGG